MLNSRTSLTSDVNQPRNGTRGWTSEDRTPGTEVRDRNNCLASNPAIQHTIVKAFSRNSTILSSSINLNK